jgi:proteasome assembly chaperone (PAC2) family protein
LGIKLYREPHLEKPDMIASWPGIGNIGILAIETLKSQIRAEELGEIEPWDFFYPKKVIIRGGVLQEAEFPSNKFHYKRLASRDLIFFTGEEQPADVGRAYAEGAKAYEMANLVLDVAERFGCQRVYTSGAAVALTHHTLRPKVWAVTSSEALNREIRDYPNTVLMGEVEGMGERGSITGLNGLLVGLAKKRGFEAICLMGEIPDYLSAAPFPYPRASKSVLEVLAGILEVEIDYGSIEQMALQVDEVVGGIYEKLPPEIRERIDQRKVAVQPKPEAITEEDEAWIKEHIDELFKGGGTGDERAS